MAINLESYDSYEKVKARLDEIVNLVNDETMPLDDALDLYEEAVKLGMHASDMIEQVAQDEDVADDQAEEPVEQGASA